MATSYNIDYIEKVDYAGTNGHVISFDYLKAFGISNNFRDYSWEPVKLGNTIAKFKEGTGNWTLEVGVNSVELGGNGAAFIDEMMQTMNYDVRRSQPGTLIIKDINGDEWRLKCYMQSSAKKIEYEWIQNVKIGITSSYPWWTRTYKRPYGRGQWDVGDLDFPFDYLCKKCGQLQDVNVIMAYCNIFNYAALSDFKEQKPFIHCKCDFNARCFNHYERKNSKLYNNFRTNRT